MVPIKHFTTTTFYDSNTVGDEVNFLCAGLNKGESPRYKCVETCKCHWGQQDSVGAGGSLRLWTDVSVVQQRNPARTPSWDEDAQPDVEAGRLGTNPV